MRFRQTLRISLLFLLPTHLSAQASAYIPLDDPRMPIVELLIARGDLRDPSPMTRPIREADLRLVIAEAGLAPETVGGRLAATLLRDFPAPAGPATWAAEGRAGFQSFTSARRDQTQPLGSGGTRGYGEVLLGATAGSVVAVARGAAEKRLILDPDWPGDPSQDGSSLPTRFIDAYLSAQWKYVHLTFGQRERNWGPEGLPGIGISNAGYPRTDVQFDLVTRQLRFTAIGARLRAADGLSGAPVGRYLAVHRLALTPHPSLTLALWETAVIADRFDSIDTDFFNPLTLLSFSTRFGWGDDRNVLLGGDASWRTGRVLLEAQAALDDYNPGSENPYPNRWAFALGASGPLGAGAAWRVRYTTASSLAFRTLDPVENLTDGGVGIGRNFADNEQWLARVLVPLQDRWVVTPEASYLRQGEGGPRAPWPTPAEAGSIPTRFIGEVTTSLRLGVGVSGTYGPVRLAGAAAWQRTTLTGRNDQRLEARLTATIGHSTRGPLQ